MRRSSASRPTAAIMFLAAFLILGPLRAHAADPQPYVVQIQPTGDGDLDKAIKDSATLISLKDKIPVGGFALTQRARDDADRFQTALNAFGYYAGNVTVTIGGHTLSDPTLPDAIDKAPAAPPLPVTIAIVPGPRFRIGQIAIQGTLPPGFMPDLGIATGKEAKAADVLAARDKLLSDLREASYPLASVTLQPAVLHRDRQTIDVLLQVDPGRRAALGPIRFDGLREVSEDFLRRHLLLRPGPPFQ